MIPYTPVTAIEAEEAGSGDDSRSRHSAIKAFRKRRLRQGLLAHAIKRLSLHAIGARFAFPRRFDRAAASLMRDGGGAVSPGQAAAYFGQRLFLEIDPNCLAHRLEEKYFADDGLRWVGEYFLDGGDWQNILLPIDRSPAHLDIIEICQVRHRFREGNRYRKHIKLLEIGRPPRRNGITLDTPGKLDAYFEYHLALVENVERSGIVPRSSFLRADDTRRLHRSARSIWQDLAERDIGVAIASDGTLVRHTSGKHRLAAAIGLGLTRVPVEIRMVHVSWLQQQMRQRDLAPTEALSAALEQGFHG